MVAVFGMKGEYVGKCANRGARECRRRQDAGSETTNRKKKAAKIKKREVKEDSGRNGGLDQLFQRQRMAVPVQTKKSLRW
jgi:hypothetical protein